MTIKKLRVLTLLFSLVPFCVEAQSSDAGATMDTASLRMAVQTYPDSLPLHEQYIKAFVNSIPHITWNNQDSAIELLTNQYKTWMRQFPHSAIIPFAIGDAFANTESPSAKPYLLKAVELNPRLAKAWMDLSIDADRWGNKRMSTEYLLKASKADPDNPDYASYYAFSFRDSDPGKWRSLVNDIVKHFPKSEAGANGLYWIAFDSHDVKEKVKIYKQMHTLYPPDKFDWSQYGMSNYFYLLIKTNPAEALSLAKEIAGKMTDNDNKKEWEKNVDFAEKINKAQQLIASNKPDDALQVLSGATVSHWTGALETLNLLKAKAMVMNGNVQSAYDSLIVTYAKFPHDKTRETLFEYGRKLGKDEKRVNADVWEQCEKTAKQAHPFTLRDYLTNDSVSLSDFHGKTVLLTFWFPGCGPCRGEFPHFQKIVNEFKAKGENIVFLGINVEPKQNEYVIPFMKGTGYSFIPLEGNSDWAQKSYGVYGEPTNFLIDGNGKIIFTGFMIQDEYEEQMLKLMINSMMDTNHKS
ncbi:MAG: TlpA family protein disulfide reductase [Chitinophagaceae bacterium]|nr:MAG: TlpA family protein disulfide reductase [Chitinophagaceae bacterium]